MGKQQSLQDVGRIASSHIAAVVQVHHESKQINTGRSPGSRMKERPMQDAFPGIDSFVELPEEHREPFGAEIDGFVHADGAVVHPPICADQPAFRKEFIIQIRSGGGSQDVKAG